LSIGSTSTASADTQIAGPGSDAGQVNSPGGLAFDEESELLYVADQGNNRIDVFTAAGVFVRAFGWGVSNGSAEPQVCTSSCQAGSRGGGAGQFNGPRAIAVDNDPTSPSHHDIYVFDAGNSRVEKLTPTGSFLAAWGGGVITAGAQGIGDLTSGSRTIASVATDQKAFLVGQTISGAGISAGTRIAAVGSGTIVLSKAATATGTGVSLSVAEGAGNIAVNELQRIGAATDTYTIRFRTPEPSDSVSETPTRAVTPTTTAAALQTLLEGLSNISSGDVAVSGPAGGPFEVEFKGRFADTDVEQFELSGTPPGVVTLVNGHSAAAVCTVEIDCVGGVEPGTTGSGAGQFGTQTGTGAVAVGQDGTVHVGGSQLLGQDESAGLRSRVQVFNEGGAFSSQFTAGEGHGTLKGLAVDAAGASYVGFQGGVPELAKFSATGTRVGTLSTALTTAVTLSATGDLFAGTTPLFLGLAVSTVEEFDASGTRVAAFYGSLQLSPRGLVAHSSPAGDIYVSEGQRVLIMDLPEPGPIVHPETTRAAAVKSAKATLEAAINPEGKASTYHFEYVDDATYQAAAPGHKFDSAQRAPASTGEDPVFPADFDLHRATLEVSDLLPETTYHLRAVAENASGTYVGDEGQTFKTKAPLEIVATFATEVSFDSARLNAKANPLGTAATGFFEYVDDAAYQADKGGGGDGFASATKVPAAPLDLGAGELPATVSTAVSGLAHNSGYHYRFIANDHCKPDPSVVCTFTGPAKAFVTFKSADESESCPANAAFRIGLSQRLPNCRAYEMVSPVDKNGGDIKTPVQLTGYPASLYQSALSGEGFAFSSYRSFGPAQGAPFANQYLAHRVAGVAWESANISPPRSRSFYETNFSIESTYKAFSQELEHAWLLQDSEPTLAVGAPVGFPDLYRRENADGSYRALNPTPPPTSLPELFYPELQGVSADGGEAIFKVKDKLTEDAAPGGTYQVYEAYGEGQLRLVSMTPAGNASTEQASAGTNNNTPNAGSTRLASVTNALSADGSRVFWSANTEPDGVGPGKIYVRLNATQPQSVVSGGKCVEPAKACTVPVSQKGETRSGAVRSQYEIAAVDGSRALFIALKPEAGVFDLYSYDVASNKVELIAGEVDRDILGASDDATRVYFPSKEVLTGANAQGNKPTAGSENLYLYDANKSGAERFRYVATLVGLDLGDEGTSSIDKTSVYHTGRVSGNAETAIFTSVGSPTGYDNDDAVSGEPSAEVYRYDATAAGGAGQLLCLSCNPTGARPVARHLKNVGGAFLWWAAATLPGGVNTLYYPRSLTDEGRRVYFNAYDSLLPTDTNGRADVYQWEAPGAGGCTESSTSYSPPNGGCLSLISSGTSRSDSDFLDSSASGQDVFFTTSESLLPQDPGLIDVYDAREGGGMPQPPARAPTCEGESCLGPAAVPPDQTPASAVYVGPGNSSGENKPKACPKGKARRGGRCVRSDRKRRKHRHRGHVQHHRGSHERKAVK
jgi:hypothetical protein